MYYSTSMYKFGIVQFFSGPKNYNNQGPPVIKGPKVQQIMKQNTRAVTSPKKGMDEFVFLS